MFFDSILIELSIMSRTLVLEHVRNINSWASRKLSLIFDDYQKHKVSEAIKIFQILKSKKQGFLRTSLLVCGAPLFFW